MQVFCAEIEYVRTSEVFSRLPTKSLPYIFRVSPQLSLEGDGAFKLTAEDAMQVALRPSTPDDTVMGSLGIVLPLPCI